LSDNQYLEVELYNDCNFRATSHIHAMYVSYMYNYEEKVSVHNDITSFTSKTVKV